MTGNDVLEAVFDLEDTGNTCAANIANYLDGSVVDAIGVCGKLVNQGLLNEVIRGYQLTDTGMARLDTLTR